MADRKVNSVNLPHAPGLITPECQLAMRETASVLAGTRETTSLPRGNVAP
jgi:hypothetical protein